MHFRSYNGYARTITYLNAKVAMPITSSRKRNQDGHEGILGADYGSTTHLQTGEQDPLVCRAGVYVMNMNVKRKILGPNMGLGLPGNP